MKKLNTTQHVKIWISKNPDEPLGIINELRLIRHRVRNPHHTIHLVTDFSRLSSAGLIKLKKFALHHSILVYNIYDLPLTAKESKLMVFVRRELTELHGNLAAASDILRWFKSILSLGIYSDLDREIDFRGVPNEISIEDFLISNDSEEQDGRFNNDVLAFPDPNHPVVDAMQASILNAYETTIPDVISGREDLQFFDDGFIRDSVITTSGPYALREALKAVYTNDAIPDGVIRKDTWNQQAVSLEAISLEKSLLANKIPLCYDNSWLEQGEKTQQNLVRDMNSAASKIQFFYRHKKAQEKARLAKAKRQASVPVAAAAAATSISGKRVKH